MSLVKTLVRSPEASREFARCLAGGAPFHLLEMKLYLTRRCNLRCAMCNAWSSGASARDELGTDEVRRVIDEAHALGLTGLKLFGGEPMLRRDLESIVEHASRLGVRCTLITNGTLLTAARAQALVGAGLAAMDLSLDAPDPARHDAIRGLPGAWQRARQGLQHLRAAERAAGRRVNVRVNAVVMRDNYLDMPRLARTLYEWDVDEIALSPAIDQSAGGVAAPYLLRAEDVRRYNAEVAPAIAASPAAARVPGGRDGLYLYGTSEEEIEAAARGRYVDRLEIGTCFKPWYYAVVRENGDVLGCNTVKDPAARIGSLRETPLAQLWDSPRYGAFRAACRRPSFADCARCCYRYALLNRRVAQAVARTPPPAASGPRAR